MPGMQDLADHNALTPCCAADGKTPVFNQAGLPLLVRAVDFNSMVAQRDGLLEALIAVRDRTHTPDVWERVNAAIAKATGGAQ